MTDMGYVSMVLDMQITTDREAKTLTISQTHYAKSVLARLGMAECNPVRTTGASAELFLKQPDTMLLDSTGIQPYQAITGALMLLRYFDITYAVNQLLRAINEPSKFHMTSAKHLVLYIREIWAWQSRTGHGVSKRRGNAMRAGEATLATQVNLRLLVHAGWRTTELQDCASKRDGAVDSGGETHLSGTRNQGGDVSIKHNGRVDI